MEIRLWAKAEDGNFYPLPKYTDRKILLMIMTGKMFEGRAFKTSNDFYKAILESSVSFGVEYVDESDPYSEVLWDYVQHCIQGDIFQTEETEIEDGDYEVSPGDKHLDHCPSCGTTEMLCGYNGNEGSCTSGS